MAVPTPGDIARPVSQQGRCLALQPLRKLEPFFGFTEDSRLVPRAPLTVIRLKECQAPTVSAAANPPSHQEVRCNGRAWGPAASLSYKKPQPLREDTTAGQTHTQAAGETVLERRSPGPHGTLWKRPPKRSAATTDQGRGWHAGQSGIGAAEAPEAGACPRALGRLCC